VNTSEPFVRFRKMERFNKDLVLKPLSHRDVLLGYVTERERVCYSASWILKPGQHICRVIMLCYVVALTATLICVVPIVRAI
jgi:hypothetical protein